MAYVSSQWEKSKSENKNAGTAHVDEFLMMLWWRRAVVAFPSEIKAPPWFLPSLSSSAVRSAGVELSGGSIGRERA